MKKLFMLALVTLMFSVVASAASTTLPCATGPGADVNQNVITCPLFNIPGQAITGATLNLLSGTLSLTESFSAPAIGGNAQVVTLSGNWAAYNPVPNVGSPFNVGAGVVMAPTSSPVYAITPGAPPVVFNSSGPAVANSWISATPANYASGVPANFVFNADGFVSVTLFKENDISATQTVNWTSSWSVTYDYIPEGQIPEPSTFAMLGGALVGLAALARRKK